MIDATAFQAFYGATTGKNNIMTQALKAGIPYEEAEKLAGVGSSQMALLYALTGPINPRIPGLNKLDDIINNQGLINNVIKAYKESGKEGARKAMSNGLKRFIPDYNTLSTFVNEGF